MKKLLLPLLLVAAIITTAFTLSSKKQFIPPGTVQINDTLFADDFEISNFYWQEFEWWTINAYGKYSKEHLAVLPDTLVWRDSLSHNEPYVQYYYRHKAYSDYPVVGISYEQALGYCKWRTERVKTFLSIKKNFKHPDFEYRLPTKREWELFSEGATRFLYNNGKDQNGQISLNFRYMTDAMVKSGVKPKYVDVTNPVKSYEKNHFGLYNVVGNVSEMIMEKGISKGAGWIHTVEECLIGKDIPYTKPKAWLGFRCVCIIKNNRNS